MENSGRKRNGVYDEEGISRGVAGQEGAHTGRQRAGSPSPRRRFPSMEERRQGGLRHTNPALGNSEENPHRPSSGKVDADEAGLADHNGQLGKGFTGSGLGGAAAAAVTGNPLSRIVGLLRRNKKKSITGAIVGFLVTITLFLMSIGQGPFELIHLSQILQKPFGAQEEASETRARALYRWARSGSVGEARLSEAGSRQFAKLQKYFEGRGIVIGTDSLNGHITSLTIDLDKHPDYAGMPREEARARIIEENGLDSDRVSRASGGKIEVSLRSMGISEQRTFMQNLHKGEFKGYSILGSNNLGKIHTAMKFRTVVKYYNIPSWLHPLKRADAEINKKTADWLEKRRVERERKGKITEKSPEAKARIASIKSKLGVGAGIAGGVGMGAGALCFVKDVAGQVPQLNRENVQIPAMASAGDAIALGAQIQAGDDFGIESLESIIRDFKNDNGETIWDSQPLQATAKDGRNAKGKDLDPKVKQGFSNNTDAAQIEQELDNYGADAICSTAGMIVGGVISVVAVVATGGAGAVALVGSTAVSAAVLPLVTEAVAGMLAEEPLTGIAHNGPKGGGVDAYGARELANTAYRASGGIELSDTETIVIENRLAEKSAAEFKSKSFFARMFDLNDYRSLASQTIDRTDTDPMSNISNVASGLFNFSGAASTLVSTLTPKAAAEEVEKYYWNFPRYGLPDRLLDDISMEDPYDNAEKAVGILKDNDEYMDRAKRCFGVDITNSDWNVVAKEDINPQSKEYLESDCNHVDDPSWRRIIMFVFDTRLMASIECHDGDQQACTDLGIEQNGVNTEPAGESATLVDGSAQELAKKMLEYKNQGKYTCDNAEDCADIELMSRGESISCDKNPCGGAYQACHVDQLDKKVLQLMIYLIDSGYKIGTYALCRSHSDSGGVHDDGLAVDISSINGKSLGSGSGAKELTLEVDKIVFDFKGRLAAKQIITWGVGGVHYSEFAKYNRSAPGVEGGSVFDSGTLNGHMDHIHVGY